MASPAVVSIYDGSTDPKIFIQQFKIQSSLLDWDSAKQLANFPVFLKGKAARVISELGVKTAIKDYYDAIITACELSKETLMRLFYARKRKPDETLAKYGAALQALLWAAVPTMDPEHQQCLIKAQLCIGLSETTKQMLNIGLSIGAKNWDNVLACIDGSESSYGETRSLIKQEPIESHWTTSNNSMGDRKYASNNSGHDNNANRLNGNINRFSSNQRQFDGNCDFCNEYGHKASFCSLRSKQRGGNFSRGGSSSYNRW